MKNNNDPKQIIYQGQQVDEPKQLSYKKKLHISAKSMLQS